MSRFVFIIGVLGLLNAYVAWRVFGRATPFNPAIWGLAVGFFCLQLAAPLGDRLLFSGLRGQIDADRFFLVLDWTSYLALGVLSCLVIYGLTADVIGILWKWASSSHGPFGGHSVDFNRRALLTLGLATAGTTVIGVSQAMAGPLIRTKDIPMKGLPAGFDGFRIAQISDLHVGPIIGRAYVENVVAMTMGLKADLIALTGDFIDGTLHQLQDDVAPLGNLSAPHGVFFVTGNHEYYWGAERWIEEFRALGATPLCNEHRVLRREGDAIVLAGITDLSAGRFDDSQMADVNKALVGAPEGVPKILLAHQPNAYEMASAAGVDLQLSGHTHAGQYFPFSLLIGLFQRYYKGLNRHEGLWIYVNRGTGFWGPPLRTTIPSEITLLTLRAV